MISYPKIVLLCIIVWASKLVPSEILLLKCDHNFQLLQKFAPQVKEQPGVEEEEEEEEWGEEPSGGSKPAEPSAEKPRVDVGSFASFSSITKDNAKEFIKQALAAAAPYARADAIFGDIGIVKPPTKPIKQAFKKEKLKKAWDNIKQSNILYTPKVKVNPQAFAAARDALKSKALNPDIIPDIIKTLEEESIPVSFASHGNAERYEAWEGQLKEQLRFIDFSKLKDASEADVKSYVGNIKQMIDIIEVTLKSDAGNETLVALLNEVIAMASYADPETPSAFHEWLAKQIEAVKAGAEVSCDNKAFCELLSLYRGNSPEVNLLFAKELIRGPLRKLIDIEKDKGCDSAEVYVSKLLNQVFESIKKSSSKPPSKSDAKKEQERIEKLRQTQEAAFAELFKNIGNEEWQCPQGESERKYRAEYEKLYKRITDDSLKFMTKDNRLFPIKLTLNAPQDPKDIKAIKAYLTKISTSFKNIKNMLDFLWREASISKNSQAREDLKKFLINIARGESPFGAYVYNMTVYVFRHTDPKPPKPIITIVTQEAHFGIYYHFIELYYKNSLPIRNCFYKLLLATGVEDFFVENEGAFNNLFQYGPLIEYMQIERLEAGNTIEKLNTLFFVVDRLYTYLGSSEG